MASLQPSPSISAQTQASLSTFLLSVCAAARLTGRDGTDLDRLLP